MRKVKFVRGEYYHIYSRTILNAPEFKNYQNADKLFKTFLLANSTNSGRAFDYLRNDRSPKLEKAIEIAKEGKRLVGILCYVIMPDHYHLLIKELKDSGITNFIRKCNISIAKYINIKNNRRGTLFESRFQSKHIDSNEYLLHLSVYIHLNPLDFISGRDWRENKLKDWPSIKNKLIRYPWSSLRSFLDEGNENPIISGEEIILKQFSNRNEYGLFLREWAEEGFEVDKIKDMLID